MLSFRHIHCFTPPSPPQSLLEAHDIVASKCYEVPPPPEMSSDAAVNSALMQADAVRMIGIRKKAGEPLVSGAVHVGGDGGGAQWRTLGLREEAKHPPLLLPPRRE